MVYSRYYRTKLTETERKIYDEVSAGIAQLRSDVRTPFFDTKNISRIVYALNFDNPQFFYVDYPNMMLLDYGTHCIFRLKYHYEIAEIRRLQAAIDAEVRPIICAAAGKSKDQAALYLHDRLIRRCIYKKDMQKPCNAHNIVGPFLNSFCVCEGYAKAYKYLADLCRLRCFVVSGEAVHPDGSSGAHAWNIIKTGGNCYHVDVTFDDLIAGKYCSRAYFKLSTSEILYDHVLDKRFALPDCRESGTLLKTVGGTNELMRFMEEESRRGSSFSEVRLTRGFSSGELLERIKRKLTNRDIEWVQRLDTYWYAERSKTLCLCWK